MKKIYILLFVITLYNCGGAESSKKDGVKPTEKSDPENQLVLSDISMQIPEAWVQEEPSGKMRFAQLAYKQSPEVKLTVFYFGQQDMVEANIQRWKSQFANISSEQSLTLNDESITAIKLKGSYKKKEYPMAQEFTETPNYAMIAAIVPTGQGPYYLKIVAAEEIIDRVEVDFIALINSKQ